MHMLLVWYIPAYVEGQLRVHPLRFVFYFWITQYNKYLNRSDTPDINGKYLIRKCIFRGLNKINIICVLGLRSTYTNARWYTSFNILTAKCLADFPNVQAWLMIKVWLNNITIEVLHLYIFHFNNVLSINEKIYQGYVQTHTLLPLCLFLIG